MDNLLKYISVAALLLPAAACTEENPEDLTPAIVMEQISIVMDDETTAKLYTDPQTGVLTLPMVLGETVTLGYSTVPEDISTVTFPDLAWSSSNTDAVSVDEDGVMTAVGAGTSVVTVTTEAINTVATASVNVSVVENPVAATSITITDNATMTNGDTELPSCYIGETMTLTASIQPEDATYRSVLWSSGDESIAVVDRVSGVVTGVSVGSVTITATALDAGNPVTATHQIYIDQVITPLGIRINNLPSSDDIFSLSDISFTTEFETIPAECTQSLITWTSDNESIATVQNGVVTFKTYGTVKITATCPEGELTESGFDKSISFTLDIPAGYYNDIFSDGNNLMWDITNAGASITWKESEPENYVEIVPYQQDATKARGDFKRTRTTYLSSSFPILCFRFDDFNDSDKGGYSRNINLDTSGNSEDGTKYSGNFGGSNNKWKTKYRCSDGSSIFVYDLGTQEFPTGGAFPANSVGTFSTFQIKYADIATVSDASTLSFRVFWFKTFESEAALASFLNGWSSETGITYDAE